MIELRCGGTMHGKLDDNLLEVKCDRRKCGARRGVVVLHTFDLTTGNMVGTKKFADPAIGAKHDNSRREHSPLRTA